VRERRPLQGALNSIIVSRRGNIARVVDHASWLVDLLRSDRERFCDRTKEDALAWCGWWQTNNGASEP
jgi:hypothetical protein